MRPHIERCIEAGRMSSSAIAADLNARGIAAPNGGQWFLMQVRRVRDRLGPMIERACGVRPGVEKLGVNIFADCRGCDKLALMLK